MSLISKLISDKMPPKKKHKTRSSFSCYGAPAKLSDSGSLFTLKEVLAAVAFETEQDSASEPSKVHIATVEKKVRLQFLKGNPRLPLIADTSAIKKI